MAKDDELKQLQDDIKRYMNEHSEESEYSEEPKYSEEPEYSDGPEISEESEYSEEPENFDGPEVTDVPEDFDEPEVSDVMEDLDVMEGFDVIEDSDTMEDSDTAEETDTGRKKSKIWSRILFAVGILMIAYAVYSIASLYWNYHQSNQEYDDITKEFVTVNQNDDTDNGDYDGMVTVNSEGADDPSNPWYNEISVDLAGLQAQYPDVAGWLYQEGATAISYPIMYNEDDVYYLHKTYKGTYAYAGSIFMETLNNRDFSDSNTIIYGHNMRNGSMFGTLKYLQNDGYIDTHGYFQIFLEDQIRRYQVFAYEVVSSDSWVYQVPFGETEAFTEYINKAIADSQVDTGVEVTNQDHIIVFSTCYGGTGTTKRFVVFAVWMDTYYYDTGLTQSEIDASAAETETDESAGDTAASSEAESE